jgi:mannose-6-phosphate isomerase-like protein (cupin superfamily)
VVDGEAEFRLGKVLLQLRAGSFIATPPGVVHSFSSPGPGSARLINVHAPSCDFYEYLHVMDESNDELDEATHAKYDVYEVE